MSQGEASTALAFLDPELAKFDGGVDLVRSLINPLPSTPEVDLRGPSEDQILTRVVYHRLQPQLAAAVADGRIMLSANQQQALESSLTRLAIRRLQLESLVGEVTAAFAQAGVEWLVLKGVATGELDFPDGAMRQTSDLDVLVGAGGLSPATDELQRNGFTRRHELNLLDKGQTWEAASGIVDIHTRPHAAGRGLGKFWWDSAQTFELAGSPVKALSRGGRLGHAASHYAVAYPNHRILSSLLDIATLSPAVTESERAEALRFLVEVGVADIAYRITSRAATLLNVPSLVIGQPGNRALDRVLRRAYDRPDLDLVSIKLAKTYGMPWREKGVAVKNLLAPSQEFLTAGGYTSHVDRLSSLWRRRSGGTPE